MTTKTLSEKKLKRITRINEVVNDYFNNHPGLEHIAATHLMPIFIRKGIFPKDTDNGLPIRSLLRDIIKHDQLSLLKDTNVKTLKRSYYFYKGETKQ